MKYIVEYTVRPVYRCRAVVEADSIDDARRAVSDFEIDELIEKRYQMDVASVDFDQIAPTGESKDQ